MLDGSFRLLGAFLQADPDKGQATRMAIILFVVLGAILAAFFVAVVLLTISRRRSAAVDARRKSLELDAWKTAGERIEPLDGGPRQPE
ncbi:MAG: hypothetical protein KJZ68_00925 [Phycisphaerales bacterium]|nr:hypothetical protein [Phycisphaerales bacterium]